MKKMVRLSVLHDAKGMATVKKAPTLKCYLYNLCSWEERTYDVGRYSVQLQEDC